MNLLTPKELSLVSGSMTSSEQNFLDTTCRYGSVFATGGFLIGCIYGLMQDQMTMQVGTTITIFHPFAYYALQTCGVAWATGSLVGAGISLTQEVCKK